MGESVKNDSWLSSLVMNTSTTSHYVTEAQNDLFYTNYTTSGSLRNITDSPIVADPFCLQLLYLRIGSSQVRIWDVMILIPNVLFLLYLLIMCRDAVTKLGRSTSAIFTIIFVLVFLADCVSIVRCVVSMAVSSPQDVNVVDRVVWLILKFFLFATEISVVTFGLLFGHLDSRTSMRKVVIVAFSFSLVYSACQGVLEFKYQNAAFHNPVYTLFGHGGLIFWFVSSICQFLIYSIICCLPFTNLRQRLILPTRRSFYFYCLLLALLDATQAVGCILLFFRHTEACFCIVDVTAYLYFIGFAPFVYIIFLRSFFVTSQPAILFSYRRQADEDEDVSLPRQPVVYNSQEDTTVAGEDFTDSLDSTQFNCGSPFYAGLGNRPELSINPDVHFPASGDRVVKSIG